jgi:CheY-like chemotaxis protein
MNGLIKISIVENDPIYANLVETRLQTLGYHVVSKFISGKDAIDQLPDAIPDMMVVSITIPGEPDGIETAKEIISRYHIPTVFLTESGDDETFEKVQQVPGAGCVQKPFRDNDFRIAIGLGIANFRELRQTQEKMALHSMVLENMPAGIIVTDSQGLITCLNDAARVMLKQNKMDKISVDAIAEEGIPIDTDRVKPGEKRKGSKNSEIVSIRINEEFRICPECGYERGFHSSLLSRSPQTDGRTKHTKIVYRVILICPECGAQYDVGWRVSFKEQVIHCINALDNPLDKR